MTSPFVTLYDGFVLQTPHEIGPYVVIGVLPVGMDSVSPPGEIGPGAILRSHTVIYAGVRAGRRLQTGHGTLIREYTEIGDDVSIGSHSVVEHHVILGDRVRIHSQAFVPEYCILETDSWIGPNVVLTNARYPKAPNTKTTLQGVRVRRGAKIGANATVLPGVVIGEGALVGAGSVVTKDVPAAVVVQGNPAIVVKDVSSLPYGESREH